MGWLGQWVGGWRKEGKHVTSLEIDGGGGRDTQHDDNRVCPATFALSRRRRKKEGAAVCCVLVLSLAPLRSSHCSCIPGTRVCLFLGCVCVFPGFLGLGKAWKGLEGGMDSGNRIHYHGKFQEARGDTNTEKGYDYNTDLSLFFRPLQTSFVNTCRTFTAVRFLSFRGFKWGGGWLR